MPQFHNKLLIEDIKNWQGTVCLTVGRAKLTAVLPKDCHKTKNMESLEVTCNNSLSPWEICKEFLILTLQ